MPQTYAPGTPQNTPAPAQGQSLAQIEANQGYKIQPVGYNTPNGYVYSGGSNNPSDASYGTSYTPTSTLGTVPGLTANFSQTPTGTVTAPAVVTADAANDHIDNMTNANQTTTSDIQNAAVAKNNNAAAAAAATPPTTTPAPTGTDTSDDPNATLDSLFANLGEETNPNGTADGMTPEQEQTNANTIADDQAGMAADQTNLAQVSAALDQMDSGTFPLPPAQQAQVDALKTTYASALQAAQTAAQNLQNGMTAAQAGGESAGLEEYSPALAMSNIQGAIIQGNDNIGKINGQLISAQSKLTDSLQKGDYTSASRLYTEINQNITDRSNEIDKINTAVQTGLDKIQANDLAATKLQISTLTAAATSDATAAYRAQTLALSSARLSETEKEDTIKNVQSANGTRTAAERSAQATSQFGATFSPNFTFPSGPFKGESAIDQNGYIKPAMWQAAIADAPAEGLTRADFIKAFGNQLYSPDGLTYPGYGLTPAEQKLISGTLTPETSADANKKPTSSFNIH